MWSSCFSLIFRHFNEIFFSYLPLASSLLRQFCWNTFLNRSQCQQTLVVGEVWSNLEGMGSNRPSEYRLPLGVSWLSGSLKKRRGMGVEVHVYGRGWWDGISKNHLRDTGTCWLSPHHLSIFMFRVRVRGLGLGLKKKLGLGKGLEKGLGLGLGLGKGLRLGLGLSYRKQNLVVGG